MFIIKIPLQPKNLIWNAVPGIFNYYWTRLTKSGDIIPIPSVYRCFPILSSAQYLMMISFPRFTLFPVDRFCPILAAFKAVFFIRSKLPKKLINSYLQTISILLNFWLGSNVYQRDEVFNCDCVHPIGI